MAGDLDQVRRELVGVLPQPQSTAGPVELGGELIAQLVVEPDLEQQPLEPRPIGELVLWRGSDHAGVAEVHLAARLGAFAELAFDRRAHLFRQHRLRRGGGTRVQAAAERRRAHRAAG